MRKRRSYEEMTIEPSPVMYTRAQMHLRDGLRSSFPRNWRGTSLFDYRAGWTRFGDFFAEGYLTRDEMKDLVHNRFGVAV